MRRTLNWWNRSERHEVFSLDRQTDFRTLSRTYRGSNDAIGRILDLARRLGCKTALVETRYIDGDYRSEHSHFYSTTFRRYPSIAHRIHFFRDVIPSTALEDDRPSYFIDFHYVGYCVIRPVPASPIGRTVLPPPPELETFVSCQVSDEIDLFGSAVTATGAPFMTQESQLGVCIHVAAWLSSYIFHLRYGTGRYRPGEIAGFAPQGVGRMVPAPPMSIEQLCCILEEVELPGLVYAAGLFPENEDLQSVACRYLDSGFPVIVAGKGHAFVLVGYRRTGPGTVDFIRQNDLSGPYEVVKNFRLDEYSPWAFLIIPLPAKLYVSGEKAVEVGRQKFTEALLQRGDPLDFQMLNRIKSEEIDFQATAVLSNDFKHEARDRFRSSPALIAAFDWHSMAKWIWVVEAVDMTVRAGGQPCVIGEVIVDGTDHVNDLRALTWRVPGSISLWLPDSDRVGSRQLPLFPLTQSVCRVDQTITTPPGLGAQLAATV
jgi:hypothetical protein